MADKENTEQQSSAGQQHSDDKRVVGRPFQKGQSGNPSGRPKGSKSITPVLRETIAENDIAIIVRNLIDDAKNRPQLRTIVTKGGSYETYDNNEVRMYLEARTTILDRLDGKLSFASDAGGGSVSKIIIEYDKPVTPESDDGS